VLLEALNFTWQDKPRQRAGSKDVRTWHDPSGIVKRATVKNLHRRKSLKRKTNAIALRSAKAEMQHAAMIN
jgi:hypothetical protein